MKKLLSSLLIIFVTIFVAPAYADDACKNLFDKNKVVTGSRLNSVGRVVAGSNAVCYYPVKITVSPGDAITISGVTSNTTESYIVFYDASDNEFFHTLTSNTTLPITNPNISYIMIGMDTDVKDTVQIERGSTATTYQPYNPLCATCQGIVKNYESATGTVAQNGTPTPENPIEPVFYKQGDMILRKVGNIADSYDATTGKITRRIGMKVLDGTESWGRGSYTGGYRFYLAICDMVKDVSAYNMSSQYQAVLYQTPEANIDYSAFIAGVTGTCYGIFIRNDNYITVQNFKNYLAQQYANGTPVVVYYPLETETTEDIGTTYCVPEIKIATTAYNAAQFNPVKTDLNSAVATIREIVTKTINQTAAIASLQADKQTRPEDACPAGKKCLLVETEENGIIVPHWFPIIEAPE
ncbi:MAG: hypothetical protein IJS34_01095 [Alphaproteobacteria bacterium]|nr:hypothetical protein [Alphaproteobacteria bacterium]